MRASHLVAGILIVGTIGVGAHLLRPYPFPGGYLPGLTWTSEPLLPDHEHESRAPESLRSPASQVLTGHLTAADAEYAWWPADRGAPYWTPSEADIAALEALLPSYLSEAWPRCPSDRYRPLTYFRQYAGYTASGEPRILINAACRKPDQPDKLVSVADGGPCYFRLHYVPSTRTFCGLTINGPWPCDSYSARRPTRSCS